MAMNQYKKLIIDDNQSILRSLKLVPMVCSVLSLHYLTRNSYLLCCSLVMLKWC